MSGEREILIEGRGISAHNLAADLADNGWDVLLSGKEYTTPRSWFVLNNRLPKDVQEAVTKKEIPSHSLDACRFVIVDSKTEEVVHDFTSETHGKLDESECIMIDDKATKKFFKDKALANGSVSIVDSRTVKVEEKGSGYKVLFANGDFQIVKKVVDASGSSSNILRNIEGDALKDNALVFWIYGWRVRGGFDSKTMVFPLKDKKTGRMSWISPWSETTADVLAADYCRVSEFAKLKQNGYFQETYERFRQLSENLGICRVDKEIENISGRIRIVPVDKHYGGPGIFSVGDSAGQACPNMAEGVPPAILNSTFLGNKLNTTPSYKGEDYYKDWRFGSQKIQPYELSAAFVLERYPKDQAGSNAKIYKALGQSGNIGRMLRIMSERIIRPKDIPTLLRIGMSEPSILTKSLSLLVKSRIAFTSQSNRNILYGENI